MIISIFKKINNTAQIQTFGNCYEGKYSMQGENNATCKQTNRYKQGKFAVRPISLPSMLSGVLAKGLDKYIFPLRAGRYVIMHRISPRDHLSFFD